MTSAGGLVPIGRGGRAAGRRCCCRARPAACWPAAAAAAASGFPDAVTFDMGGTSTDVCLVQGGVPEPAGERSVGGLPDPPAVARRPHHRRRRRLDRLASTRAARSPSGPRSAGAVPGPGLLRPRRHRADGDRRRPRGRPHPRRRRASRARARSTVDAAARGAGRAPASTRRRRDRRGRRGHGAGRAGRVVARGVDPPGLALVAFGGAGPLHACALADALGMAAVIVPARAGVLSAVGLLCRAAPARRWCGRGPTPADHAGLDDALADAGRRGGRRSVGRTAPRSTTSVDCRYAGQSHELPGADGRRLRRRARAPQRLRPARTPVEVVALRATARSAGAARARPTCRAGRAAAAVGPGGGRRARLHRLGARRLAGRPAPGQRRPRPAPGSAGRPRERRGAEPGRAAGADRPAHRRRRGDGRGAAPGRVQPQHQGAGRLLGRPVHRRRRAAGAGRAHPGAPRLDAGLGARPPSPRSATTSAPATRSSSTTRSPAAPTSTTSPWSRPCFTSDGAAASGWAANRAHHADLGGAAPGSMPADATEIQQEGLRIPPVLLTPEVDGDRAAPTRARPTSGRGDLDAQVGANRGRRRAPRRAGRATGAPLDEVRRPTASAACGPRSPPCPTARGRFEDVLDLRPGARPAAARPRSASTVTVDGDAVTFDFTGTDPQRRGQRQRGRGGDGQRGRVRPAVGRSTRRSRPTAAPCARSQVVAPAGTVVAARSPAAVGAGNVEVSQRVADVCLGALAQAVPDRVPAPRRRAR